MKIKEEMKKGFPVDIATISIYVQNESTLETFIQLRRQLNTSKMSFGQTVVAPRRRKPESRRPLDAGSVVPDQPRPA
jgi:hypothetical protein